MGLLNFSPNTRPVRDKMLVANNASLQYPRPVRDGMLVKNGIIPTIPVPSGTECW